MLCSNIQKIRTDTRRSYIITRRKQALFRKAHGGEWRRQLVLFYGAVGDKVLKYVGTEKTKVRID